MNYTPEETKSMGEEMYKIMNRQLTQFMDGPKHSD